MRRASATEPRTWRPEAKTIQFRPQADGLADPLPLLLRVIDALGTNAAARLLDADRAQVSRWSSNKESIGPEMGRRIVDLHDVLTRVMRVFNRDVAAAWLLGSEPLLGGARPIDVLALEGAAGLCLSRTHYDIELEHYLAKLLDYTDSDIAKILQDGRHSTG